MSEEPQHGMSMEDFLNMISQRVSESMEASMPDEVKDQMIRGHEAIHVEIEKEYRALCERTLQTDALRDQPDLPLEVAARGYAQHFLAARMAAMLVKYGHEIVQSQEYEAQKLEHQAMVQRWMPVLARIIVGEAHIDAALRDWKES